MTRRRLKKIIMILRHRPKHLFDKTICINTEYLFIRFGFVAVHTARIFAKPTGFFRFDLLSQRACVRARTLTNYPASLPLSLHHRRGTTLVGANKVFHIANFHPPLRQVRQVRKEKRMNQRIYEWEGERAREHEMRKNYHFHIALKTTLLLNDAKSAIVLCKH